MPYGIANTTGMPEYRAVRDLIHQAIEGGVAYLDTAPKYGLAERRIGRALRELPGSERIRVCTKVWSIPEQRIPCRTERRVVRRSVEHSLRRLHLDRLPVCLLHREDDIEYLPLLREVQESGLAERIGVSVNSPAYAMRALDAGAQVLQVPTNLLDQRFVRAGVFERAAREGVQVFVRSAYLQGYLLLPEAEVPERLRVGLPVRRELTALAERHGISLAALAFRYVLSLPGVSSLVVGVETPAQLESNLSLFRAGPLSPDLVARVQSCVPDLPDEFLMPMHWTQ